MMLVSNTMRADDVISQFRILGGELSNSAATSVSDIDEVLPRMKALGLNTVLVPGARGGTYARFEWRCGRYGILARLYGSGTGRWRWQH